MQPACLDLVSLIVFWHVFLPPLVQLVELALGVACLLAASSASSASESFPLDGAGLPPALLGLCFASLGVGNAITTVQTLYQKRQKASLIARIRRQKSQ